MSLSGIDIVFIIIIVILAIRCTFRGFVTELLSMAALLLGVIGAVLFSSKAVPIIEHYLGDTYWNKIIAFLAVFLIVFIIVKIFQGLLNKLIEKIHLQKLDRALGFLLGLLEGVLLVSLILFVLQVQPFFEVSNLIKESIIAGYLAPLLPYVSDLIREKLQVQNV
jgi:membrane protein required for colicin V production